MEITGPAAGHDRLKTSADPTGTKVLGTVNNCAGGVTPWGTYVMAEENFHGYFSGELPADHPEAANYKRYGVPEGAYDWASFYDRFDVAKEPNEPNRFGWIVEVDPIDPTSVPKKRTALGRFKHEGAESIVAKDGRVVFYLGDDERFDYVYKFVTAGTFNPDDRAANMNLLDEGTLYVAKFDEDGTLRMAAAGPRPGAADRRERLCQPGRRADRDAPRRRPARRHQDGPARGHPAERRQRQGLRDADQQHASARPSRSTPPTRAPRTPSATSSRSPKPTATSPRPSGTWEVLLKCGDPSVAEVGATFSTDTTANGWFGMPDNCAIDAAGRLWVATDGKNPRPPAAPTASGPSTPRATRAPRRSCSSACRSAPRCAARCSPPTMQTLFVAVQHPGDGGDDWEGFGRPSYYEDPSTRWPDFKDDMPVRPSVVAITKQGGGKIAS